TEMKDKLSQENLSLDEIFDDMNSSLYNVIAKLSQDDMNMPWSMIALDRDDDAIISRLSGDFPTWVADNSIDLVHEDEWQYDPYHALEDEE
nr:hypothetical protein [Tanacetum cinerariifolium]